MIRKENHRPSTGCGRRPLLVTFAGNNRQMLNEIRDNLSYLRKNQPELCSEFCSLQLSQSATNFVDKSAGGKMTRTDNQHQKALAEIRDSLRPYQNVGSGSPVSGSVGSEDSSSVSSTSSQASSEAEKSAFKVQQIMQYGFDEDIAVRALQLSGDLSVDAALRLLVYIMEEKIGCGFKSADFTYQRPNFGSRGSATSDTNSVRSDSPSVNSSQQRHLLASERQTPPPLPPRAPINAKANHTHQTAVASASCSCVSNIGDGNGQELAGHSSQVLHNPSQNKGSVTEVEQNVSMVPSQNSAIPMSHVQQIIQTMSPGKGYHHMHVQPQVNGTVRSAVNPRGVCQVTDVCPQNPQAVSNNINGCVSSSGSVLSQQLHSMFHRCRISNNPSPMGVSSVSLNCGQTTPPSHTQAPPPPYSQACLHAAMPTRLCGGDAERSRPSVDGELQTRDPRCAHVAPDTQVISTTGEHTHVMRPVASTAVSVTRKAVGSSQMPVIMPSVHSKEVPRPTLQTATAPECIAAQSVSTNGGLPSRSHISKSPLPNQHRQTTTTGQVPLDAQPRKDIQVPTTIPSHVSGPHGSSYSLGQIAAAVIGQQPSVRTLNHQLQNHLVALTMNKSNNYYHFPVDTSVQDSRSDSPVTRSTNQPPKSLLSTDSSPSIGSSTSTGSDGPENLPPPYPGRAKTTVGVEIPSQLNLPVIPPRVSLKSRPAPPPPRVALKNKPAPPPPPVSDQELTSPPRQQEHMINILPSQQPTSLPHSTSSSSSSSDAALQNNGSSKPVALVSSENGILSETPDTAKSTLQESINNTKCTEAKSCTDKSMTRLINNSETEDTETDTASSVHGQDPPKTKCSTSGSHKKHRCMSPLPERKLEARERDRLFCDTKVKMYSPQAFKFYMEQHVENVLKSHAHRINRRMQLEKEMAKVSLSDEAAHQVRKMLHQKESNYIRLKRAKMDCSMFEKIQTLGCGAFGEVALVRKKDIGTLYAMKTLKKSNVIKRNQVAHVKAERDILAEADNEWVVKLYYSFQDTDNLYFVMDYVPGGDVMGLLIRKEILEEQLAQFYIAELVLAIESVHRMGFIHRDIKPDNILIDKDGHIKLTDFGLCTGFRWTHNSKYYQKDGTHARQDSMEAGCQLDDPCQGEILKPLEQRRQREQKRYLAHSLVGTPNYIAPEVLLRLGYTKVCDWWSVGVILYEMVIGQPPFYATSSAETQYKVINWKDTLMIPDYASISPVTTDLILQLLQGADNRLGRNGATEVKEHTFFTGVNFECLRSQPAPLKPTIKFLTDTSNFDPVDPDRLRADDSEESKKVDSRLENGKHPEHAFFEFTFRRFFDDGGHPCSVPSPQDQEATTSPVFV